MGFCVIFLLLLFFLLLLLISCSFLFFHIKTPIRIQEHLRDSLPRRPLSLAFVGKTGVGKTEFEKVLARLVMRHVNEDGNGPGILRIFMGEYRDESRLAEYQSNLRWRIAQHVWKCPRAMIVLDELHLVADGVLDVLMDILGNQQPVPIPKMGTSVDFRRATFIFTSMDGHNFIEEKVGDERRRKKKERRMKKKKNEEEKEERRRRRRRRRRRKRGEGVANPINSFLCVRVSSLSFCPPPPPPRASLLVVLSVQPTSVISM